MSKNQILAALQIENSEIRLVVGEYYNDLFYVICKECIPCKGTNGIRFVDNNKVIESIKAVAISAGNKLNVPLERVILCVPGYRFKKETKETQILLENNIVEEDNIKDMFAQGYKTTVGSDYEIINVSCAHYKINGIVYPKMPLEERGDVLYSEMDLICGDRLTLYDYVSTVESAGLKVIDICQDGFAACKEAALFEQSFNGFEIGIHLEASHTVYSLISNGRVVSGTSENTGYDQLIKPLMEKYKLSYRDVNRILFRYAHIGENDSDNRIINKWESDGQSYEITYDDVQKCINEASNNFLENIYRFCKPIVDKFSANIIVTGQGAALQQLSKALTDKFKHKVDCYCPDKLGVREHKWSSLVGAFEVYRDNQKLDNNIVNSVDVLRYRENLVSNNEDAKSNDITSKLKTITDRLFSDKEE